MPKLNQDQANNLNRPTNCKEIDTVFYPHCSCGTTEHPLDIYPKEILLGLSAIFDSSVASSLFRSIHHFLLDYCSFDDKFLEFFVYFGD